MEARAEARDAMTGIHLLLLDAGNDIAASAVAAALESFEDDMPLVTAMHLGRAMGVVDQARNNADGPTGRFTSWRFRLLTAFEKLRQAYQP